MSFLKAIFMGLIQGITEFLPVSSSGHLAILGSLLHIDTDTGILFDVMLHMGTLIAIILVFWEDIQRMFWEALRIIRDLWYNLTTYLHNKLHESDERNYRKILHNNYRRLLAMLFVSTIPTAILGFLFQDLIKQAAQSLLIVGVGLWMTGVLLLVVDYWKTGDRIPKDIKGSHAVFIGICQGIGCFPGISRSGITITAGLLCGFRKNFAVRYSFLMSIPAILGAMILELGELGSESMTLELGLSYVVGMIVAAFFGYLSIRYMLKMIQKKKFKFFAIYCFFMGVVAVFCHFR